MARVTLSVPKHRFLLQVSNSSCVSLQRAKSPQQLYNEVVNYDLVLTPDAPLASAINRRIDKPHFGTFAIPPRRLAAGRREQAEDRLAFLEVIDQTDHDWKAVAYAIGNVLQCWEHQGTIDALLEYDTYVDDTTREVVEIMAELQTTSSQLTDYTITDQAVAVIGYEQLTTLERSVLPAEFDRIDLFTEEPYAMPEFHIFDSPTHIVDALLDTITAENAENVAVVLDAAANTLRWSNPPLKRLISRSTAAPDSLTIPTTVRSSNSFGLPSEGPRQPSPMFGPC